MNRLRHGSAVLVASLAIGTGALAGQLGQAADVQISWWRVALGLILCLALTVGAALALKTRMGGGAVFVSGPWQGVAEALRARYPKLNAAPRRLKLVETLRLTPQLQICLLACDDLEILIAATPQGAFVVTPGAATGMSQRPS